MSSLSLLALVLARGCRLTPRSRPGSHPVLLGIDDAQGLFATSSYVDPTYQPVESFSLTVPRLLLEYISGAKSLVRSARSARLRANMN